MKLGRVSPPTLLCLSKIVLVILIPLIFFLNINFEIWLSISLNNLLGFCLDLCWINRSIQSDWHLNCIVSSYQWILHISWLGLWFCHECLWFSAYKSCTYFVRCIPTQNYVVFDIIFFRISNCLLLVYRTTAIFCILTLYSMTLLNSLY